MDSKIKEALIELWVAVIHSVKIFLVYILPSILVAVLVSSEFRDLIESTPALAAYVPLINVVIVVIASYAKNKLPEDSRVRKIL